MESTPLKMKLRYLTAEHSLKDIYSDLLSIMEEEYSFLTTVFTSKKTKVSVKEAPVEVPVTQEEAPVTNTIEDLSTGLPKIRPDTKIRIVKKAQTQELVAVAQEVPAPTAAAVPASAPLSGEVAPKEFYDPKDLKKWQKEKEQEKYAELQKQGINPESLLTVESMKKWIEQDGRTYAYVAREFIGLPEAVVAAFAKKNGIKSTITKKRAILAAGIPRK